jgi:site-specific recombinase XerC
MQEGSATNLRSAPANKGRRCPADPPRVEEIVAVMREAGHRPHGLRLRGLIVVLWRAGLRIAEALALNESDLEPAQGTLLVRNGKGGHRRVVGMDDWGWQQLRPWLEHRRELPIGALFCVIQPAVGRCTVGEQRRPPSPSPTRSAGGGAAALCAPSASSCARR